MSGSLNLPVLIYISKQGCPACTFFNKQWDLLKTQLSGKARLVKFVCDASHPPPPALRKYSGWFPSVILAGPKSYFRIFTPDDQINTMDYSDEYEIRAQKFNAVETSNGFEFAGRPNTSEAVMTWFINIAPTVSEYHESAPPSQFMNQCGGSQNYSYLGEKSGGAVYRNTTQS